jgi:hypothetical protein
MYEGIKNNKPVGRSVGDITAAGFARINSNNTT